MPENFAEQKSTIQNLREAVPVTLLPELIRALPWAIGALGLGYLTFRWIDSNKRQRAAEADQKFRDAKGTNEIEFDDHELEGVEFDLDGIIISDDRSSTIVIPLN